MLLPWQFALPSLFFYCSLPISPQDCDGLSFPKTTVSPIPYFLFPKPCPCFYQDMESVFLPFNLSVLCDCLHQCINSTSDATWLTRLDQESAVHFLLLECLFWNSATILWGSPAACTEAHFKWNESFQPPPQEASEASGSLTTRSSAAERSSKMAAAHSRLQGQEAAGIV